MVQRVTGWQGNDGGQGGWQQPPWNGGNQPQQGEPYDQNPHGYHAGPQGTAPYSQPGPYQSGPYQTGGFPAQNPYGTDPWSAQEQLGQYNPYGGYPDFSPEPPKRSKLPMILGVLAIVIIVGAVVAIVLVNRNGGGNTANPPATSSEKPDPTSKSDEPTSPSSNEPGGHDGWQTIDNTADASLTYQVPPDWKKSDAKRASGLDVDFTGSAEYGVYDCQGASYVRSFAASGDVQSKEGADLDLNKTVTDFAKSFGTGYYKDTAKVDVGTPEETEVGGKKAVKITAPVTPKVSVPKCEAAKGEIAIIGVLLEDDGQPAGVAMLVVVSDAQGGPDDPKPLPADVAQDILDSARVG
jgi:hypothetical protein